MFHYGKAYSIVVFVTGGLVSYLTDIYWLLERNLPDLLARLFSDEAESNLDEQSTNTSHFHKPLPPGASFPNQPRTYLPVSHVRDLHRSVRRLRCIEHCAQLTALRNSYWCLAQDHSRLPEVRTINQ